MNYRIEEKGAFQVVGVKKRVRLVSEGINSDIDEMLQSISDETYAELETLGNLSPEGFLHVCANFSEDDDVEHGELDYFLAVATTKQSPEYFEKLDIPALNWAVFEVEGPWEQVSEAWGRIYSEWLPSSGYELDEGPEIMCSVDQHSEIWIPVLRRNES